MWYCLHFHGTNNFWWGGSLCENCIDKPEAAERVVNDALYYNGTLANPRLEQLIDHTQFHERELEHGKECRHCGHFEEPPLEQIDLEFNEDGPPIPAPAAPPNDGPMEVFDERPIPVLEFNNGGRARRRQPEEPVARYFRREVLEDVPPPPAQPDQAFRIAFDQALRGFHVGGNNRR